jgi:hypothetical protein
MIARLQRREQKSKEGKDTNDRMARIMTLQNRDVSTHVPDDPLLCAFPMPLRAVHYPLGFAVEVRTNSHEVLAAAKESWGDFPVVATGKPALRLRIGVADDTSRDCPPAPVCRGYRNVLSIIADAENYSICDRRQGFGFAWLSKGAVENKAYLRYHFLEASALCLIAAMRATPLHAACVAMNGCGVLLCGDSGAGKSSLAFACARAGWTYITDDATYLVQGRKDRLAVGNSNQVRFRPSAVKLFPELEGLAITPRAAGKPTMELRTAWEPSIVTAGECRIGRIVFLNREAPGPPAVVPYAKNAAHRWFAKSLLNTSEMGSIQAAGMRGLLRAPTYELRYRDLSWAVEQLGKIVKSEG